MVVNPTNRAFLSAGGPGMRLARRFALGCILLWTSGAAAVIDVTLVLPDGRTQYLDAADGLRQALDQDGQHWRVRVETLATRKATASEDLLIPLGARALRHVLGESGSTPVWALLVSHAEFDRIVARQIHGKQRPLSVLYRDQPLSRQLHMLTTALPNRKRLGVLASDVDANAIAALRQAADSRGLALSMEQVSRSAEVVTHLGRLRDRVDILLLLPDPVVLNGSTLELLMLETYRLGLPVMANSLQLIETGALLALYASPAKLGQEAGMRLRGARGNTGVRLPAPAYPDCFDVVVNRSVALSLDIRVPAGELIRLRMMRNNSR